VIAVTATDMMVLAGVQPGACERRYGARPIRGRLGPESGLRILLAYLARRSAELDQGFRPLLAYVRDHHVRAFVEVGGPRGQRPTDPIGTIDPDRFDGPPVGDRGPYGPMWLGPLLDPVLVRSLAVPPHAGRPREVELLLTRLTEETAADRPFFYEPNVLAHLLGLSHPPSLDAIRTALTADGFVVTRTHARPEGFRTTAPRSVVEARMRALAVDQSQNARVRA
jgi:tRNA (guanine26-N2/guanine27-N2)-dimethyltransferase